jgi:hypothetical protein
MNGHKKLTEICSSCAKPVYVEVCNQPTAKTVSVPNCDGSVSSQTVDRTVGAYLLNEHHYSAQRVYDVSSATITGNITTTIVGSVLTINTTSLSVTNDTLVGYLVDYGNGYTDIIAPTASSVTDFVNQPNATGSARYEVKIYAITQSGNVLLLTGIEYTWNGTTLTQVTANPISVNRSYQVERGEAIQRYCDNAPVGTPFNANGTAYTVLGAIGLNQPIIRDERFSAADVTLSGGVTPTVTTITPVYATNRTLQTPNTTPAAYTVATIANSREITVQNVTSSDVQITTSQGVQIVAARSTIALSNPNNTTISQSVFTGNITVTFLNSVGATYLGANPRVIINQKAY